MGARTHGSILIPAIVLLLLGNMLITASLHQTGDLSRIATTFERKVDLHTAMRNTVLEASSRLRLLDTATPDFDENFVHAKLCGGEFGNSEGTTSGCTASLLIPPLWRPDDTEEVQLVNAQVLLNAHVLDAAGNKITALLLFSKSPAGTVRLEGADFSY